MPSFWVMLLLFAAYSMMGWAAETLVCSVAAGKFINRGFLNGPFCPIYGFGALLIAVLLAPARDNLPLLFLAAAALAGALEYLTGFGLETLFHTKYWDYSTRRLNLQGRVCLGNALLFGLGGVLTLRVLQPALLGIAGLMPLTVQTVTGCVLLAYFLLDTVFTANTLVRLNGRLAELQQVLDEISEKARAAAERTMQPIAPIAGELTERARSAADETFGVLAEKRDTLQSTLAEKLDESSLAALRALYENRERIESGFRLAQRRILRAFPTMKSPHNNESLLRMRKVLRARANAKKRKKK